MENDENSNQSVTSSLTYNTDPMFNLTVIFTHWYPKFIGDNLVFHGIINDSFESFRVCKQRVTYLIFKDEKGNTCCLEGPMRQIKSIPNFIKKKFTYSLEFSNDKQKLLKHGIPEDWVKICILWKEYIDLQEPKYFKWEQKYKELPINIINSSILTNHNSYAFHNRKDATNHKKRNSKYQVIDSSDFDEDVIKNIHRKPPKVTKNKIKKIENNSNVIPYVNNNISNDLTSSYISETPVKLNNRYENDIEPDPEVISYHDMYVNLKVNSDDNKLNNIPKKPKKIVKKALEFDKIFPHLARSTNDDSDDSLGSFSLFSMKKPKTSEEETTKSTIQMENSSDSKDKYIFYEDDSKLVEVSYAVGVASPKNEISYKDVSYDEFLETFDKSSVDGTFPPRKQPETFKLVISPEAKVKSWFNCISDSNNSPPEDFQNNSFKEDKLKQLKNNKNNFINSNNDDYEDISRIDINNFEDLSFESAEISESQDEDELSRSLKSACSNNELSSSLTNESFNDTLTAESLKKEVKNTRSKSYKQSTNKNVTLTKESVKSSKNNLSESKTVNNLIKKNLIQQSVEKSIKKPVNLDKSKNLRSKSNSQINSIDISPTRKCVQRSPKIASNLKKSKFLRFENNSQTVLNQINSVETSRSKSINNSWKKPLNSGESRNLRSKSNSQTDLDQINSIGTSTIPKSVKKPTNLKNSKNLRSTTKKSNSLTDLDKINSKDTLSSKSMNKSFKNPSNLEKSKNIRFKNNSQTDLDKINSKETSPLKSINTSYRKPSNSGESRSLRSKSNSQTDLNKTNFKETSPSKSIKPSNSGESRGLRSKSNSQTDLDQINSIETSSISKSVKKLVNLNNSKKLRTKTKKSNSITDLDKINSKDTLTLKSVNKSLKNPSNLEKSKDIRFKNNSQTDLDKTNSKDNSASSKSVNSASEKPSNLENSKNNSIETSPVKKSSDLKYTKKLRSKTSMSNGLTDLNKINYKDVSVPSKKINNASKKCKNVQSNTNTQSNSNKIKPINTSVAPKSSTLNKPKNSFVEKTLNQTYYTDIPLRNNKINDISNITSQQSELSGISDNSNVSISSRGRIRYKAGAFWKEPYSAKLQKPKETNNDLTITDENFQINILTNSTTIYTSTPRINIKKSPKKPNQKIKNNNSVEINKNILKPKQNSIKKCSVSLIRLPSYINNKNLFQEFLLSNQNNCSLVSPSKKINSNVISTSAFTVDKLKHLEMSLEPAVTKTVKNSPKLKGKTRKNSISNLHKVKKTIKKNYKKKKCALPSDPLKLQKLIKIKPKLKNKTCICDNSQNISQNSIDKKRKQIFSPEKWLDSKECISILSQNDSEYNKKPRLTLNLDNFASRINDFTSESIECDLTNYRI